MSNIDPGMMLKKLDEALIEPVSVVVCGGLVIELAYGGDGSRDVDALDRFSAELKGAVIKVAEATGHDPEWFNDHAVQFFSFDQTLPDGWRDRAYSEDLLFKGKNLKIYPLARRDLLLTKLFGVFSRGGWDILKDVRAIKNNIKASSSELTETAADLHSMLAGTSWARSVDDIIKNIKEHFE